MGEIKTMTVNLKVPITNTEDEVVSVNTKHERQSMDMHYISFISIAPYPKIFSGAMSRQSSPWEDARYWDRELKTTYFL